MLAGTFTRVHIYIQRETIALQFTIPEVHTVDQMTTTPPVDKPQQHVVNIRSSLHSPHTHTRLGCLLVNLYTMGL